LICNTPGHLKNDCNNQPVTWNEYVELLKDTSIPAPLFEPLDNSYFTPNNSASSGPKFSSTPSQGEINEKGLRQEFNNLIKEAFESGKAAAQGLPNTPPPDLSHLLASKHADKTAINPTIRNRPQDSTLTTGRGRGQIDPTPKQPKRPSTRGGTSGKGGKGLGRGQNLNQNPAQNYNQTFAPGVESSNGKTSPFRNSSYY
jgi:hypothetical protein